MWGSGAAHVRLPTDQARGLVLVGPSSTYPQNCDLHGLERIRLLTSKSLQHPQAAFRLADRIRKALGIWRQAEANCGVQV
jgi:hypothetical protein